MQGFVVAYDDRFVSIDLTFHILLVDRLCAIRWHGMPPSSGLSATAGQTCIV